MSARGYFVTGTGTGVGKTVASAYLVLALGADYWKPVQSGLDGETDSQAIARLTGLSRERIHPPAHRLRAPLSPHEAARRDGVTIVLERFTLPSSSRPLIVEGAGGALVPLNADALMVDLMRRLALPVVLVATSALGTINHTLLSLEALRARRIEVAGVVMTGEPNLVNRQAIQRFGRVSILAELPQLDPLDACTLNAFARAHPFATAALA